MDLANNLVGQLQVLLGLSWSLHALYMAISSKNKSQVRETFIPFKALVDNKFNTRIGTFYIDNGVEFVALMSFLSYEGISHFTSPPYTPEHHGISERKHRHIIETGLPILTHAGVPNTYWPYAFATACTSSIGSPLRFCQLHHHITNCLEKLQTIQS